MDTPREHFWEDFESEELHIRDRWQFALKSEFFFKPELVTNRYTQEFYFFIPNSLQVNDNTYSKKEFFLDQTTLIRYKTPSFSFVELLDLNNPLSPLARIVTLSTPPAQKGQGKKLITELKLLANVVRSTARQEVKELIEELATLHTPEETQQFIDKVKQLCGSVRRLHEVYQNAKAYYNQYSKDLTLIRQWAYIEEFISDALFHYLSGLLENIRLQHQPGFDEIDQLLSEVLLEKKRLIDIIADSKSKSQISKAYLHHDEDLLYRTSLLNKFILDALQLSTNRFSLDQQYQHWIGSFSAGIAMLLYFTLFIWLGGVFLLNSAPFILLTVIIYILKDRIKEWLRTFSYQHASRWFPDFTTVIRSMDQKKRLGVLKESFSFLSPNQLPKEIKEVRNAEFHAVLETVQRPETVLFYRRIVEMSQSPQPITNRSSGLNIIFRFSIDRFLRKASDPIENHLTIDSETHKLLNIRLPKVYHLNLIIRTTVLQSGHSPTIEIKKLRIVIDKNGIKRVEQL